jgi:cytochrome c biogenesis protein CcdA
LALYNLVFVSPMLVITALITLGVTSTEKAEAWRQSKLRFLHLIAGIIILTLGVVMLGSLILDLI